MVAQLFKILGHSPAFLIVGLALGDRTGDHFIEFGLLDFGVGFPNHLLEPRRSRADGAGVIVVVPTYIRAALLTEAMRDYNKSEQLTNKF